jgi:hypothetical protein
LSDGNSHLGTGHGLHGRRQEGRVQPQEVIPLTAQAGGKLNVESITVRRGIAGQYAKFTKTM